MSMTEAQLTSALRLACGTDQNDEGFTDADVRLLLNRSLWEVTANYDFRQLEDRSTSFVMTIDQYEYTLTQLGIAGVDYIRNIAVLNEDGQSSTLDQMSVEQFQKLIQIQDPPYPQAIPTHYVRDGDKVFFYPVPSIAYETVIYTYATIDDYAASSDTSGLPQNWDDIILWGAIYRAFDSLGDINRSSAFENKQAGAIAKATSTKTKELKDTREARLQLPPRVSNWR